MRSTRLVCVLLLLIAAQAAAQVPRTINFQGRVRDAAGAYLDGPRQCTLRIYDQPTGGTALFTEIYPAEFDNGTFTITIGSRTSGGIPESVEFDKQYWLGCTIANFNSGQEIAPRMRMSSSPYSLRAAIADSAIYAESAGYADNAGHADAAAAALTLEAPATISGSAFGAQPVLEVINQEGPIGLRVHGAEYAIVSDGVDSTGRHYVSGENADGSTPAPGALYRDNAPMAWALVDADGSVIGGFGIASITHTPNNPGSYTITLSNGGALNSSSNLPMLAPIIQPTGLTKTLNRFNVNWFFRTGNDTDIFVRITDIENVPTDAAFSIIVMGRPK